MPKAGGGGEGRHALWELVHQGHVCVALKGDGADLLPRACLLGHDDSAAAKVGAGVQLLPPAVDTRAVGVAKAVCGKGAQRVGRDARTGLACSPGRALVS